MVLWPLFPYLESCLGTGKRCLEMEHGSLALVSLPGILFGDREEMLEDGLGSLALISLPGILFGNREEMLED